MSICPRCGAAFSCCMEDGSDQQSCWCMQLPRLSEQDLARLAVEFDPERCLCPACLQMLAATISASNLG